MRDWYHEIFRITISTAAIPAIASVTILLLFVIAVTTPECRDNYTCVRIATPTFDNPSIVALIITTGVLGHVARDF